MPRAIKARLLEPHFRRFAITGRSHPLSLEHRDFLWVNDFIGLLHRCGLRESHFLYFITRETHQRQPTLGLWPARWRREGSAFDGAHPSVAMENCIETTNAISCVNASMRCPPVLGYRRGKGVRSPADSLAKGFEGD